MVCCVRSYALAYSYVDAFRGSLSGWGGGRGGVERDMMVRARSGRHLY